MTAAELLGRTVAALDRAGIPCMLTGSLAAGYYGAGRSTLDIDLVIDPADHQLESLVSDLTARGMYVSLDAAREALSHESMFNVIDAATGWKADLIVRKRRPFSEMEFSRRSVVEFAGTTVHIASIEDVIIAKLEWAKLSQSSRQLDDVTALLRLHASTLDRSYLALWIGTLSLGDEWQRANR